MLTLQLHRAIEARAAVVALKKIVIPIFPVLVLLAATYSVPVHSARRNLHLVHFWGGKEMGSEPLSVTHAHTHAVYHICTCISAHTQHRFAHPRRGTGAHASLSAHPDTSCLEPLPSPQTHLFGISSSYGILWSSSQ